MTLRPRRALPPSASLLTCNALTLAIVAALASLTGCGSPGMPQPPSLKLPTPPADLTTARSGDTVFLHWTMPGRATDRVPLTGAQHVVICRSVEPAPCAPAGQGFFTPGASATYADPLPAPLRTGRLRLLTYTVLLENRHGRFAGPSNTSFTAAGPAPPAVAGLEATPGPQGILLHWHPAPTAATSKANAGPPETHLLHLHRSRVLGPGEAPSLSSADARNGVPQPLEQPLELTERSPMSRPGTPASATSDAWLLDHALDTNALLNRTYRYTVARVARLTVNGHPIEITSEGSDPAIVDARDLFPPSVPSGLVAVGDPESGAIDLSWTPDTEPDLAGYFIYRRPAGSNAQPVRVSGSAPIMDTAWRDTTAQPGTRYAYSVSAVDRSGNESARSPEALESVAPAPREQTTKP